MTWPQAAGAQDVDRGSLNPDFVASRAFSLLSALPRRPESGQKGPKPHQHCLCSWGRAGTERARNGARAGTTRRKRPEGAPTPHKPKGVGRARLLTFYAVLSMLVPCVVPARAQGCEHDLSRLKPNERGDICEVWGPFVPTQSHNFYFDSYDQFTCSIAREDQ